MVVMDAATRRNLELTSNLAGGLDNTLAEVWTPPQRRWAASLQKRWLHQPVRGKTQLQQRRFGDR